MASQAPIVVSDPAIMMGKPTIIGTRITVELILEKLAAGETVESILEAHPRLTREVLAGLRRQHQAWMFTNHLKAGKLSANTLEN